jgi:D-glycero-D-manno-heptose 1,7-bisphosphate phosphatase
MTLTKKINQTARPAIFFDRDGVLNKDHGYVCKIADWQWIEGAIDAVRRCNELDYFVFVVTNQSGVGRGYYTEQDIHVIHTHMQDELKLMLFIIVLIIEMQRLSSIKLTVNAVNRNQE